MPKTEIDYSNTIIYKITCKDPGIKDVYVGHTTNFVQRKHAHKQSCINVKSTNHKCKLYTTIRENGGWQNWTMEIINFFNCNDHYEARIKEHEYFMLLNATLNSIDPMPKPKSSVKPVYNVIEMPKPKLPIKTTHNVIEMSKTSVNVNKFKCEKCDYTTCRKSQYNRHVNTPKHNNRAILNDEEHFSSKQFICNNCNKCYKARNGLWYHQQTCNPVIDSGSNNAVIDKEFVMLLIKENSEFKTTMIDLQNKMLDVLKIVTNNSIQPN